MFEPKIWVLERIGQCFELFFQKQLKSVILPLFVFSIIWMILFQGALYIYLGNFIESIDFNSSEKIASIFSSPNFAILLIVFFCMWIIYLISYMPIQLATIKSIQQLIASQSITPQENIHWWVKKLQDMFTIYYHMFMYTFLIPSVLFIIGGLIYIASFSTKGANDIPLDKIWIILMVLWWVTSIVFSLYRWTKSSISLYHAIETDNFGKQEFQNSLVFTENKVLRTFWNLFLVWFIGWLMSNVFSSFISSFWWIWGNDILSKIEKANLASKWNEQVDIASFFQIDIFMIVSQVANIFLSTLLSVFVMLFIYVYYLSLKKEKSENPTLEIKTSS